MMLLDLSMIPPSVDVGKGAKSVVANVVKGAVRKGVQSGLVTGLVG